MEIRFDFGILISLDKSMVFKSFENFERNRFKWFLGNQFGNENEI
jgi:hypothetical protein